MFSGLPRRQRQPRHRRGDHRVDDVLGLLVGIHRDHVGAVDHDVGDFEFADTEHILDVFRLAFFELAVFGRGRDQAFEFDVAQDFVRQRLLDAEPPQDPGRHRIEQPVQRIEGDEGDVERIGYPQRYRLRFADRQGLRHLLADDDVQRREQQKADDESGQMDRLVRHAQRLEHRRQQRRNRRLADPTEAERGHGDAELAAGEISFDMAEDVLDQPRAEAVFLDHGVDAEAAALHQREFGGDIKGVSSEQQERQQQVQRRAHDPLFSGPRFSARKSRMAPGSTSLATKA